MLWKFNSVYNPVRQAAEHRQSVKYEIGLPQVSTQPLVKNSLYVHHPEPVATAAN
jgi:magnesium-protoporphyrin IX monomethyl ester (oxidative) cyclase